MDLEATDTRSGAALAAAGRRVAVFLGAGVGLDAAAVFLPRLEEGC